MASSTYVYDSTIARAYTVARMRMLTGDAYASQGRTLFTDAEHLLFVQELDPAGWETLAQRALGYINPENLPDPTTAADNRLPGTVEDFNAWNDLVRRASAEDCLALSMRNPEWSPGRHAAYRVRSQELLPAFVDASRY